MEQSINLVKCPVNLSIIGDGPDADQPSEGENALNLKTITTPPFVDKEEPWCSSISQALCIRCLQHKPQSSPLPVDFSIL